MSRRRLAFALGWLAGAVVFVALVTALLVAAVSSARTGDAVETLGHQLDAANAQLATLRAENEAQQRRSEHAAQQRLRVLDQNHDLQRQITALGEFLRRHGFDVPGIVPEMPSSGGATTPAPTHTVPSRTPTPEPSRPRHTRPRPTSHPSPTPTPAPSVPPTPGDPFGPLCPLVHVCLN